MIGGAAELPPRAGPFDQEIDSPIDKSAPSPGCAAGPSPASVELAELRPKAGLCLVR